MTFVSETQPLVGAAVPAARRSRLRSRLRSVRREFTGDRRTAVLLGLMGVVILAAVVAWPLSVPVTIFMVPLILASLMLPSRELVGVVALTAVLMTAAVTQLQLTTRTTIAIAVVYLITGIVLVTGMRRARLGVAGLQGEAMFVDLRDRILNQNRLPLMPEGWATDSALHSAGGTAFAGDFIVASTSPDQSRYEFALVDVSGKGVDAGTRALLLSGSFGALLGAVPPEGFMSAANDYLVRQRWEEGFASAVHLVVDPADGRFELRSAGHPPAIRYEAATGRWSRVATDGTLLGLVDDTDYAPATGLLGPGDAIVLYTDGMVERGARDIDDGIDDLIREADELLPGAHVWAPAERLSRRLGSKHDDRAVLVVQRRP